MAESLREVIARLKANQNIQESKETPKPERAERTMQPERAERDDSFDENIDTEEEIEKPEIQKPAEKTKQEMQEIPQINYEGQKQIELMLKEIEALQNDGRFRIELLHLLSEINKALVVIAGVLVDITKK